MPPITSSGEDRHLTRMTLWDLAATSRALSQELGMLVRQKCLNEQFNDIYCSIDSQHHGGRIVVNAHCQRAFVIIILTHHLA
ncbi:hypothetical protein TNCV_3188921 [Trichonephila clavipes]|nr:hypothetical protein TNCV_3188921 [Trichonephila clavipes]